MMNFPQNSKYPEILNPYQVLNLNPNCCNLTLAKAAFKNNMKGNENPSIRLAYDMLVNPFNYNQINFFTYCIKQKDIFYYAHVGGLDEIKFFLNQNKNLLYLKDNLGRSIFYLSARNGYYLFYEHYNVVKLINEYSNKNINSLNNSLNKAKIIDKAYTIKDFDLILSKSIDSPSKNFLDFFKENHMNNIFNTVSIFDKEKYHFFKTKFYSKYPSSLTQFEKKCIGAMLGMAIGDAMGARVEFETVDYTFNKIKDMGTDIAGKFKLKPKENLTVMIL